MHCKYALLSLLLCTTAYAGEGESGANDIARKAATCTAYYRALSEMPRLPSEHQNEVQIYEDQSYVLSSKLTNKMLAAVRVELALADIIEILDKETVDWSVIINRHDHECKTLLREYEERIRYWRNEYIEEPDSIDKESERKNA